MDNNKAPRFAGFRRPTTEFYHTPNEWTDITADIDSLAELKVIEYIMRHTWGFKEERNGKWVCDYDKPKKISIDEFIHGKKRQDGSRMDKGTKLSRQSVLTGIEKALEHGYIEYGNNNQKATTKRSYRLKLVQESDQQETKLVKEVDQSLVQKLDQVSLNIRPNQARMKETSEIQLHKKTLKESISARSSFFSSEEVKMDTLYCHHYDADPPKLTEKLKGDYGKLAPHVHTQEDMDSLIEYTEAKIKGDDPQAYPGNLARWVNSWKLKRGQDSTPLPWSQPDTSPIDFAEEPEIREIVCHIGEPLPDRIRIFVINLCKEFGEEHRQPQILDFIEECYQRTTHSEEDFYYGPLDLARGKARKKLKDVRMSIFLEKVSQSVIPVVESMIV